MLVAGARVGELVAFAAKGSIDPLTYKAEHPFTPLLTTYTPLDTLDFGISCRSNVVFSQLLSFLGVRLRRKS